MNPTMVKERPQNLKPKKKLNKKRQSQKENREPHQLLAVFLLSDKGEYQRGSSQFFDCLGALLGGQNIVSSFGHLLT